ncbi:MAG TPA: glycosyltransferase [Nitrospirota bacterium]|nr:glycosyltransferase [Nitrospirota bacterium]
MDKIKIFHIVESFGAGVFSSVTQLCNHIDKDKFNVFLVHALRPPETPMNYQDYIDEQVKLIHIPMTREISLSKDIRSLIAIYKVLKEHRPHAIHLHSSKAGFLGRFAARMLNIRNIYYSPRGFSFLREDVSRFKRRLYFILEKIAACFGGTIIGCSTDEFSYAKTVSSRSILIPNGVDLSLIEKNRANDKWDKNKIIIGTSGRISPQKNPHYFCNIASSLADKRVAFVWIGDGEMGHVLEGSDVKIIKTGWKNRKESLNLVSMLDIYIQSSLWEGMPIAVLEAMALGKPVVATDIVGNRDLVIHGKTGYLSNNESDFVNFLRILVDDQKMRREMGEAGRAEIALKYDIRKLVKQFEVLYSAKE